MPVFPLMQGPTHVADAFFQRSRPSSIKRTSDFASASWSMLQVHHTLGQYSLSELRAP